MMMPQSWIGQTIGGRYQIEALLGQGGMSAVYRGVDPNLRRVIAIKLIHPHLSVNPDFVERFKEEAAAVASLRHPNIVQVHDFNNDGQTYYMVMEYLAGETLQARLKRLNAAQRHLSLEEALRFSRQICEAASYAHRRGLVHRDIKPANVMLDLHGQAILMDFGIVKIVGGQYHTSTGATIGTAMYMSPEQIRSEVVDERCDIYSLGVMLFEMLSGRPPYEADSALTVMMMHLNDPVPDLRDLRPEVPAALLAVIQKALAKDRAERYQTAAEMSAALRRIQDTLDSATIAAGPSGQMIAQAEDQTIQQPAMPPAAEATVIASPMQPEVLEHIATPTLPSASPAIPVQEGAAVPASAATQASAPPATRTGRKVSRKAIFAGVGAAAVILAVVAILFFVNTRKPPAVQLAPVDSPPVAISAETIPAVANLATWQVDSIVEELAYSPDGSLLATANNRDWERYAQYRYYAGLWQVQPAEQRGYLLDHTDWVNTVAFSADGQWLATASEDASIDLWQVSDGSLLRTIESDRGGLTSVDISPNGKLVAGSNWDGVVYLWQASNGSLLRTLKGDEVSIREIEFSPDGDLLAAAAEDGAVRVWRVSDGSLVYTLQGHSDKVYGINFSPDGSMLASASEDQTIALWQMSDGSLLRTLEGHEYAVSDVAFSPDGSLLASGSVDTTVRIWQVSDGSQLAVLGGPTETVLSVAFSPDGKLLAAGSSDKTINFWGVSEALID